MLQSMIGFWQMLLFLLIVVILFGPSRLEKLGPSLGKAIRGFKEGLNGNAEEDKSNTSSTVAASKSETPASPVKPEDKV